MGPKPCIKRKKSVKKSTRDDSSESSTSNETDPRPMKSYRQEMHGVQRYCTEFEWILSDWSLRFDLAYSKGIESNRFEIEGLNRGFCTLFLIPKAPKSDLTIELSETTSILAMKVKIRINEWKPISYSFNQPVPQNIPLQINVPLEKKTVHEVLNTTLSTEAHDKLTLTVTFIITRRTELVVSENPPNILERIKEMWDRKTFCDVTFLLGDQELPAHKAIVASQSKVLETMFLNENTEEKKTVVRINDTSAEVFKEFLNYLYTGGINDLEDITKEMIQVANTYQVTELKTLCENYMLNNLCTDNVVEYLLIAESLCCTELKKQSLRLLDKSSSALAQVIETGDPVVSGCLRHILRNSLKK
ncbi:speckle-type POZ protein B-like [Venturia canescens]|uniref:speckle-type POZ protein B-like n=1 Tax=Venturia canescens TaxID=32260 RepID=UPI001C9CC75F|nr:speckle-type POZ protein B-like [Venturia canescens]